MMHARLTLTLTGLGEDHKKGLIYCMVIVADVKLCVKLCNRWWNRQSSP